MNWKVMVIPQGRKIINVLNYIKEKYTSSPYYLKIDGKPYEYDPTKRFEQEQGFSAFVSPGYWKRNY
jgi:hypothetical protein